MRDSLVAKRYARALFNIVGNGDLDLMSRQLSAVADLFAHREIGKVLRSPVVGASLKKEVLAEACKQLGANEQMVSFTNSLVDAGRVATIPSIAQSFQKLADEKRNIVRVVLCGAVAISEQSVKNVTSILEQKMGKIISAETKVDPSILGGLVVEVGHNKIDLSLKTKLENLAQSALS